MGWSYEQRGLVATVETGEHNVTAWQRFLPHGPLALLPARGGFSNIVWSTTPSEVTLLSPRPMPESELRTVSLARSLLSSGGRYAMSKWQ